MATHPSTAATPQRPRFRVGAVSLALGLGLGLAAEARQPPQTTLLTIGELGQPPPAAEPDTSETTHASIDRTDVAPSHSDLRVTLDLATKFIWDDTRDEASSASFVGVDLLHVFSGATGDLATLTIQGFFTRAEVFSSPPASGEADGEWFFDHRILNLNINLLDRSRLNLRVGHFELPFGLEQDINTNGTLRQFTSTENLGLKSDWGASINGVVRGFEYEAGLTRGSGNEWLDRERPWIASGRLGVRPNSGLSVGLSAFSGEVLTINTTVRRERVGIDVEKTLGPFTLLGEWSVGRDESRDALSALAEVNWRTSQEDLLVYLQHRYLKIDTPTTNDPASSFTLGARWAPGAHWALSAAVEQDTDQPAGSTRGRRLITQIRYRF